jgi:hypothetical protein
LIHCSGSSSSSTSTSTTENRIVPFNVLLAALRFSTKDYGLDLLDLLSVLCVLIEDDRKLLRAVPSMKDNCLIVSKTVVFPKIVVVEEEEVEEKMM